MNSVSSSRRRFLLGLAGAVTLAPLLGAKVAQAADAPHLAEADPSAKALGYVENAAKIDASKEPMFKKGSKCASCALYQAAQAAGGYAPCAAFPGKSVNANGWCKAYSAKA